MTVSLEISITRKNQLKENGYGYKGLGKLDAELIIEVKPFALYPEYAISDAEKGGSGNVKMET